MKNNQTLFQLTLSAACFIGSLLSGHLATAQGSVTATKATVYPKDASLDPHSASCVGPYMKNLSVTFRLSNPVKAASYSSIDITVDKVNYDLGEDFYYKMPDGSRKSIPCAQVGVSHLDFNRSTFFLYSLTGAKSRQSRSITLSPGSTVTLSFMKDEVDRIIANPSSLIIELALGSSSGFDWIGLSGPCSNVKARVADDIRKKEEEKKKADADKKAEEDRKKAEEDKKKNATTAGKPNGSSASGTYISPEEQHQIATRNYQNAMKNGDYKKAGEEYDKANAIKPDPNYSSVRKSMQILEDQKVKNDQYKRDLDKNTQELANNLATALSGIEEPGNTWLSFAAGTGIGSKGTLTFNCEWGHFILGFGGSYRRSPAYNCTNYEYRFYQSGTYKVDGKYVPTDSGTTRFDVYTFDLKMGFRINLSKRVYLMPLANAYLGGGTGGLVYGVHPSVTLVKKNMLRRSDLGISVDFLLSDKQVGQLSMHNWMSIHPGDIRYRNYTVISLYFVPNFGKG